MSGFDVTAKIREMIPNKKRREVIAKVTSLIESDGLEPPAEKTMYAKIAGGRGLQNWLIPYFAKALGVTEQDLFDPSQRERIAKEELRKHPMRYAGDLPEIQLLQDMVRLPYVTVGAGAEALINVELLESIYIPKELLPVNIDLKNTIIGKILGDSMEPKYRENDVVFFDMVNGRDVILPDAIYLVRYGDTVQIKQVQFLGNGDIRVISFNENYPPVQPVKDLGVDWEILGKPFLHWHAEISSRLQEKE